jgi:signal peptidase I
VNPLNPESQTAFEEFLRGSYEVTANGVPRWFHFGPPGAPVFLRANHGFLHTRDGKRLKSLHIPCEASEFRFGYSTRAHGPTTLRIQWDGKEQWVPIRAKPTVFSGLLDWLESLVFAIALFLVMRAFVVETFQIPSESMIPTFYKGDRLFASKFSYVLRSPYRGEVVIFRAPPKPDLVFIKRIIGLPGDTVEIRDGVTYVNGIPLQEPFVAAAPLRDFGPLTVPSGNYFAMGDNRNNSSDSRVWGSVPRKNLIAKPILLFWPPNRFRFIRGYPLNLE